VAYYCNVPFDCTRLHWKHHACSLAKHLESACFIPPEKIPILQEASAPLGRTSNSPCLFFSHLRHFVISSALLGGTATAILGSTLSAPFDGTRLHWKNHECSLGKHLESACLTHRRKSLFYRKHAWRFIAPRPHALRLVFKQQWSGTLGHAPAKARALH